MPINRRPHEPPPTFLYRVKMWVLAIGIIIVISLGYGKVMDDLMVHACFGEYDTPQCEKDRAEQKARAYERRKESL